MEKARIFLRLVNVFKIILLATSFVCICLLFSACKHVHRYESSVTKEPTCSSKGVVTFTCECGDSFDEETDVTLHELRDESDGDYHWKECVNCGFVTGKSGHSYVTVVQGKGEPSTCVKAGYEVKSCSCGKEKSFDLPLVEHTLGAYRTDGDKHYRKCENCTYTTEKLSHDYSVYVADEHVDATCLANGKDVYACVCGAKKESALTASHSLSYVKGNDGHYQICSKCSYQTDVTEHKYTVSVASKSQPSTCKTAGKETKSCICGAEKETALPIADHAYDKYATDGGEYHWLACSTCEAVKENSSSKHVTDGSGQYYEGDCCHYPYFLRRCLECEANVRYEESEYGPHKPVERKANEPTDYVDGNIRYWECTVDGCGRFFSGSGCDDKNELFIEDIVIPRLVTVLDGYDELYTALDDWDMQDVTGWYQLVVSGDFYTENYELYWSPEGSGDTVTFRFSNVNLQSIESGDVLTVKFKVSPENEDGIDFVFVDSVIVALSSPQGTNKVSLKINSKFENGVNEYVLIAATNQDGVTVSADYGKEFSQPKAFSVNDTIRFECFAYNGQKLKSLVVNGKSYAVTSGVTEAIKVTEDIVAEFVFASYATMNVNIDKIDTSVWNAPVRYVNPYVSYKHSYSGSPNDEGRLYKGSTTRFYVDNANITRVTIAYQDYELTSVVKNSVNVSVSEQSYKNPCSQVIDGATVTFVFDAASNYRYFEYIADSCQARIVGITIEYTTNNTFAA